MNNYLSFYVENGDQQQLSFCDDLHQQDESRAIVTPPPTSCADLAQLGNRISGFHLVLDKESNNRIQTVFCDFALTFNNPGTASYSFQALIYRTRIIPYSYYVMVQYLNYQITKG